MKLLLPPLEFTKGLLYYRHYAKPFTYVSSFNPHYNPMIWVLSPFSMQFQAVKVEFVPWLL